MSEEVARQRLDDLTRRPVALELTSMPEVQSRPVYVPRAFRPDARWWDRALLRLGKWLFDPKR